MALPASQHAMFFIICDEIVHDLGDMQQRVFRANPHKGPEVRHLYYLSFDYLVEFWKECQQVEDRLVVSRSVARKYLSGTLHVDTGNQNYVSECLVNIVFILQLDLFLGHVINRILKFLGWNPDYVLDSHYPNNVNLTFKALF